MLPTAAPTVYHPYQHGPLRLGKYSVSAGLYRLGQQPIHPAGGAVEPHLLAFDRQYPQYLARKVAARSRLHQHYVQAALSEDLRTAALTRLASALASDSGGAIFWDGETLSNNWLGWTLRLDLKHNAVLHLSRRPAPLSALMADVRPVDAFDALAVQAQEDFSVWAAAEGGGEYQALIHASYPQHWRPLEKIGRPFAEVHAPVAGIEALNPTVPKLLATILSRGPFVRFGWGVNAPQRLGHHPALTQPGVEAKGWHLWVERQTLSGFSQAGGALFTIRPYAYALTQILGAERAAALADALRSMTPQQAAYKGLESHLPQVLEVLDTWSERYPEQHVRQD